MSSSYTHILLPAAFAGGLYGLFALLAKPPSPRRRYYVAALLLALVYAFIAIIAGGNFPIFQTLSPLCFIMGIALFVGGIFRDDHVSRRIGMALIGWAIVAPLLWQRLLNYFG